jgi:putative phage-type endonuclease
MIDQSIRSKGIGASEIGAIVGLDPRRGPFDIWAEKLGKVSPREPDARMRAGKNMERVIAELYAEETGIAVNWVDTTFSATEAGRQWQVYTPDAITDHERPNYGVECKNVAWDQANHWGEPGTDEIPAWYLTQLHWSMSASGFERWDCAAFFGGNDLRIYTAHKDAEIERALLEAGEKFWRKHILEGIEPEIGATETAARYLRERFSHETSKLRVATEEEITQIAEYINHKELRDHYEEQTEIAANRLKEMIGDAEGLIVNPTDKFNRSGKITYRRSKDTMGTNWEDVVSCLRAGLQEIVTIEQIPLVANLIKTAISINEEVVKQGSRRLLPKFDEKRRTAA